MFIFHPILCFGPSKTGKVPMGVSCCLHKLLLREKMAFFVEKQKAQVAKALQIITDQRFLNLLGPQCKERQLIQLRGKSSSYQRKTHQTYTSLYLVEPLLSSFLPLVSILPQQGESYFESGCPHILPKQATWEDLLVKSEPVKDGTKLSSDPGQVPS